MKAITVKQPWASLIVEPDPNNKGFGIKDIENRTWKLPEKYKGQRVLIHASARPFGNLKEESCFSHILTDKQLNIPYFQDNSRKWLLKNEYPFGVIIGSVEIVDCVINHESIWAEKSEIIPKPNKDDYYIGGNWIEYDIVKYKQDLIKWKENKTIYNWVLANPIKFPEPIPAKGKLGFWDFDIEN